MNRVPMLRTNKEKYKEYYKQRRSVGCRPLTYFQWLDWKAKERQQCMKG